MTLKLLPFILLLHTFLFELCNGAAFSNCIENERNALLHFKKNLIDHHNRLASWKHEDCCKWEGISCDNVTGHVVRLDLRNPHHFDEYNEVGYNEWSLSGQLSPSLIGLKQLKYLDLSMNHFDGPIPKFVGSLHSLRYLNLSYAGFIGLIPPHLGNLTRLKYLDLTHGWYENKALINHDAHWISHLTSLKHLTMTNTKFDNFQNWMKALNVLPNIAEIRLGDCDISSSVFPVSLPNVNFTNLSYLDLSANSIELESIPLWLFNIKSLTHIDLRVNLFRSIPDELKNLTSLKYIDFSGNEFSGTLPQALESLKESLENLDLSENGFNGSLPDWFGELHKLKTLSLDGNSFTGCIPESFGGLVALQELYLGGNNLNGTVPKSIGRLSNLVSLDLYLNNLTGSVPKSIGRLSNLVNLDLGDNNLNGTIPKSIGQLSNLVRLDLGGNKLEGVISEVHFASLTKLKWLGLGSNNLILNVSGDWVPPFKLNLIDISSCKLGPKFPAWLQTQANISFLDMSNNGIVDTLPNWFWDVFPTAYSNDDCTSLDISHNRIAGSLPILSKKVCFDEFSLGNNFFEGPFPPSLNISGLIDISNNSFSGSVQSVINSQATYFIDLSRNKLTGNIPHTLGTLTNLAALHLGYNNLNGNIPSTLRNCTSLYILDLGMNKLEGIIPSWIGENLTGLSILVLGSNNFTGNVPSNLWKMTNLHVLNLGNNKLSGRIPQSFGNFTSMIDIRNRYGAFPVTGTTQLTIKGRDWIYDSVLIDMVTIIDLSCNNLTGHIPKELGNLHGLIYLNLSRNHLVGSIPNEIGLMHSLESLDLSRNRLSGNIPLSMSTMTTLDFLNLTYNNLSGKIPSGNQLQTLPNDSYVGNPQLCGFPLTKSCDSNKTINDEAPEDEVESLLDYWYVSIAPGFVLGFWIVWGTLLLKKEWKNAYFRYVDCWYDALYVAIAVKIRAARKGDETTSG